MKVYTKLVIDLKTLDVVEEESFEYSGPISLCGGGSGGGGSSGQVRYPPYVEDVHQDWLGDPVVTPISLSMSAAMNVALGSSPYAGALAYDPAADVAQYVASLGDLEDLVTLLSSGTGLDALIAQILDDARLETSVDAYEAQLTAISSNRLTGVILPRFEAGMRDINAVSSSAFAIGRAFIESESDTEVTREVAKYSGTLRLKAATDDAIQVAQMKLESQRSLTQLMIEAYRIKIVALKEQADLNVEYDATDAKWDLEVFQFGANLLAAPGGGTAVAGGRKNTLGSVLGGTLSGAAAGALGGAAWGAAGGPIGAIGGAVIGGVLGLGSSLF